VSPEHDRLDGRSLVLRADASTAGGTGHLMRCLALAQAWVDLGGAARWLLAEAAASLLARIAAEGIPVEHLGVPAGSPADAAALCGRLAADPASAAVVDGPAFGSPYLASLAEAASRVLLIDDMASAGATYPVGYVLNQNAHADRADYPRGGPCRYLLGLRYVLLRREFRPPPAPRRVPGIARNLLVTFGGSDPRGMTARTIGALGRLPPRILRRLTVRVIVGAASRDAGRIIGDAEAATRSGLDVSVLRAVTDMPSQLAWADLAVTSGGSTVWELARYGCPALVAETVPVEERLVSGLVRVGLFGLLGPERGLDERKMADEIAAKAEDRAWRAEMSSLGMQLVDGDGAGRVAQAIAGQDVTHEDLT
jgi:UDP-2,4-diacetamido-2,4,6-trideoxy-beta-L-altropyranose hydrolase